MKKLSLFLCAVMLLSLFTVLPATAALSANPQGFSEGEETLFLNNNAGDILVNGVMEYTNENTVSGWSVTCNQSVDGAAQNFIGSEIIFRTDSDAHSGTYALQITNPTAKNASGADSSTCLRASVNVTAGVTYEMSAWVKSMDVTSGYAYFHGMFTDAAGSNAGFSRMSQTYQNPTASSPITLPAGTWVKKGLRFTVPEGATKLTVYYYLVGKGSVLYDDIMILAPKHLSSDTVGDAKKAPVLTENSTEFGNVYALDLSAGNFERSLVGQVLTPSTPTAGNVGGHNGKYSDAYNHTEGGSKSLHLKNGIDNNKDYQPDLYFPAINLVPGATYQISTWILAPEAGTACDFSYWIDFTMSDGSTDRKKVHYGVGSCGWWREYLFDFVVPIDTQKVRTTPTLRLMNDTMEYYIDDVTIYMVKKPTVMELKTDEMFYYTDFGTGVFEANVNYPYDSYNTLEGGKVTYTFLDYDKTTVLNTKDISIVNNNADCVFDVDVLEEIGKEYFIKASVYNSSGTLMQEEIHSVYRFDRPTYLGQDGVFRKNGKEYNIMYGTNVDMELLEKDPRRGGVTIVKIVGSDGVDRKVKMDKAHEMGLLCVVGLYGNGKVLSTESIINTVNAVKDHPALYGYQVQDEPYQKGTEESILANAYVTIRNLDPHHVVNLVDSEPGGFEYIFRYADQVDIDYYGGRSTDSGRAIYNTMRKAYEASKGRKPFTLMQQAFQYEQYLPTIDEMRNMSYQAFFAGAQGISYHALGIDGSDGVTTNYMDLPDWEELCQKWAGYEQNLMLDCFVNGKYPLIDSYSDDNVMWRTFRGEDKIYLVIYNRQKKANSSATVPLKFADGSSYGYFTATRKAGGEEVSVCGTGSLSLTLGGIQVRESGMTKTYYDGLASEIWEIEPRLISENFDGDVNADLFKTYSSRPVTVASDPEDSSNKVLHAGAHGNAISILPVTIGSWTPAPLSIAFDAHEICKVTYRLYVPTQTAISTGDTFTVGLRYTDASGNMALKRLSFSDSDLNTWHNMEFYTNALLSAPATFYQEFNKAIECYVDDIEVEKVSDRGFVSTMNASRAGGASKPNVWVYGATGEYKTSFSKTDVVKPVIGFVPSTTNEKAFAAVALYKIDGDVKTLVDMKGAGLGKVALADLQQGAAGAEVIGITGEELTLDLSDYDLSGGNYSLFYLVWNRADMTPVLEKTIISIQ